MRARDYVRTPDGRKLPIRQLQPHELPKPLRDCFVPRDAQTDALMGLRAQITDAIAGLEAHLAAFDEMAFGILEAKLRARKQR